MIRATHHCFWAARGGGRRGIFWQQDNAVGSAAPHAALLERGEEEEMLYSLGVAARRDLAACVPDAGKGRRDARWDGIGASQSMGSWPGIFLIALKRD